jgi:hypothetical protein
MTLVKLQLCLSTGEQHAHLFDGSPNQPDYSTYLETMFLPLLSITSLGHHQPRDPIPISARRAEAGVDICKSERGVRGRDKQNETYVMRWTQRLQNLQMDHLRYQRIPALGKHDIVDRRLQMQLTGDEMGVDEKQS